MSEFRVNQKPEMRTHKYILWLVTMLVFAAFFARINIVGRGGNGPINQTRFDDVIQRETGIVASISETNGIILETGETLILSGIILPHNNRLILEEYLKGKTIGLIYDNPPFNYLGEHRAEVFLEGDISIQERFLATGQAWADGTNFDFYAVESTARTANIGLWALPENAIITDLENAPIGEFGIFEGRVLEIGRGRSHFYLNFGADWHTDFTAVINRDLEGLDVTQYEGQVIRMRGYVRDYNGAAIDILSLSQIEILNRESELHHDEN